MRHYSPGKKSLSQWGSQCSEMWQSIEYRPFTAQSYTCYESLLEATWVAILHEHFVLDASSSCIVVKQEEALCAC